VSFVSDNLRLFGNPPYTPSHRFSTLLQLKDAVLARFLLPNILSRSTEVRLLVFLAVPHITDRSVPRLHTSFDLSGQESVYIGYTVLIPGTEQGTTFPPRWDATYWFPSDTSPLKSPRSSVMQAIHRRAFTMRRTVPCTTEHAMWREGELSYRHQRSNTSLLKSPPSSVMQAICGTAFTMHRQHRTLSFTSELAMGREGELFL
jgi:hypothetical protein